MTRRTRILIIVAIILAVLLLIYFIYLIFQPEARPWRPRVNINENVNIGILPNINAAVNKAVENINGELVLPDIDSIAQGDKTLVQQVADNDIQDAKMTGDGRTIAFYDQETGQFYKIVDGGEPQLLTSDIYKSAESVVFSPDADKAIIEFPDGTNVMYDFLKDKQYSLPKEMENFTFSPEGDKIAFKYLGMDELQKWYATSNPDGTGVNAVDLLGPNEHKVTMDWSPQGKIIGHWWEAQAGIKLDIRFLGQHKENFASTLVEGIGYVGQWSPDGQSILYSVSSRESEMKPEIWIVNATPGSIGSGRTPLKINTWADKCTFNSDSTAIYCAVPQNLDFGAGLAREVADDNVDEIVKIDLLTNMREKIAIPVEGGGENIYTIESMFVDENENTLYFVDKNTNKMSKILLK